MKVSQRTNRICMGLAIAALVAIFCYQVAYGAEQNWFHKGYIMGLWAGKHNSYMADDCGEEGLNATSNFSCMIGYDAGFVKGCVGVHGSLGVSEATSCDDTFSH